MSIALQFVHLSWVGRRGDFIADGLHIHLEQPPSVMGALGMEAIQFEPEVKVRWCRDIHGPPRDMRAEESEAVIAWLHRRAAAMWAAYRAGKA